MVQLHRQPGALATGAVALAIGADAPTTTAVAPATGAVPATGRTAIDEPESNTDLSPSTYLGLYLKGNNRTRHSTPK